MSENHKTLPCNNNVRTLFYKSYFRHQPNLTQFPNCSSSRGRLGAEVKSRG